MTVTIAVTQDDILQGHCGDGSYCPVARATKRATNRPLSVGTSFVKFYDDEKFVSLPTNAIEFIQRYDRTEPVAPFTFELDLPA